MMFKNSLLIEYGSEHYDQINKQLVSLENDVQIKLLFIDITCMIKKKLIII